MSGGMVSISTPTLRRLPHYLREIRKMKSNGKQYVSCTKLSDITGILPITVRKDMQQAGAVGKPKTGYDVEQVIVALETALGLDNDREAILIGAGNLGYALLGYKGFNLCGVDIIAAFDSDIKKIGQEYHDKKILSLSMLEDIIERFNIKLAIIATPPEPAQKIADRLAAAGITGIWNFSPVIIKVSDEVVVQNVDLTVSLSVLLSRVSKKKKTD